MAAAIKEWLMKPDKHAEAIAACKRLAHPQAARQIAHILIEQLGISEKMHMEL